MAKSRLKRWLFCTDSHGDMIDPSAEKAFLDFKKQWKPDITIHGGDFMDLRALRKGASDEERNEGVKADIERGVGFVRSAGVQVLLWGNHDYRLVRGVRDGCGRLREYASLLHNALLDQLDGIQHIPYGKRHGVYTLGDLRIVHGYHSGIYAARQAAQCYGRVMMGHVHTSSSFVMSTLDPTEGFTVGCLCNLDMDYNIGHANTLRQNHGWSYGLLAPDGKTTAWQARQMGDKWIIPSEFSGTSTALG